ncbi:MAG: M56 family metallopeptidase [Gemmatimonadaceae bacterium]
MARHAGKAQLTHVATRVVRSERTHRRAVMLSVLALLLLAVLPMAVDHAPIGLEEALSGVDHVGALCLAALHLLLAPIHGGFHLILAAGLVYAIWDRARAWRKLASALSPLDATVPREGDAIWSAAIAVGIKPEIVRVVSGLPNPAFTVGALTARIYVTAELPSRLNPEQLRSVISHEAAHVERRDPLRLSLLRALACTLFWIPALARLAEDLRDDSEILADDVAAARGQPVILASAIVALASWPGPTASLHQGAVGFCHGALLERRVRRLLGEEVPVTTHVTRRSLSLAALALAVTWTSGVVMAHPLPADGGAGHAETHCAHESESPLAHLFCRAAHSGECPHAAKPASISHDHSAAR